MSALRITVFAVAALIAASGPARKITPAEFGATGSGAGPLPPPGMTAASRYKETTSPRLAHYRRPPRC
jgi:hypothetical protein